MISAEHHMLRRAARLLILVAMTGFAWPALAEPVGKVLRASGAVQAQGADGRPRVLVHDTEIERGDTLVTGADGTVQVRFTDDALLIVRANSRLRIDDYKAEGGDLRSTLSLVAGGIRALTGRIGKLRRDAYLLGTPTATIGVRGTDYELRLCQGDCGDVADGLYLGVTEGEIVARNEAGEFGLGAHRYGRIRHSRAALEQLDCPPPALTGVACEAGEPAAGAEPGDGYRAGEDLAPNGGNSSILNGRPCAVGGGEVGICNPRFSTTCNMIPACP
jgi:hypothetical protein